MKRIESLDYLRGTMAFSVMLYHYLTWSFGAVGPEYVLGKLGIYAVSTFYVLSGLSLTIVYKSKFKHTNDFYSYVVKRIFRIFPLFWLAVTSVVVIQCVRYGISGDSKYLDPFGWFLNYSLLFGFVKPDAYLTTGAWSIGNEMVFYAFFPLLVILGRKARYLALGLTLLSFILFVYFAFSVLDGHTGLSTQWSRYINPFNQLFLFVSGVAIGLLFKTDESNKMLYLLLLALSALVFSLIPASGDKIGIVTGYKRILFSALCILFCFFVYRANFSLRGALGTVLKKIGDTSYSIYLLHPIVSWPIIYAANTMGLDKLLVYMFVCIPTTLIAAHLSYTFIEMPAMKFASRITSPRRQNGLNTSTVTRECN